MNAIVTATTTPALQVAGLTLAYPGGPAVLDGLDWQLLPGQVVGLLGRNGAGKTTLLETLLGLREPQAGTVRVFGQPAQALDDAARARIGYVPQRSDLFESFTAAQLLSYFRSFYPRWNEAKVEGLMSRWDIDRHQRIAKLSGGQQQRLSIIRALAHEPDTDDAAARATTTEAVRRNTTGASRSIAPVSAVRVPPERGSSAYQTAARHTKTTPWTSAPKRTPAPLPVRMTNGQVSWPLVM